MEEPAPEQAFQRSLELGCPTGADRQAQADRLYRRALAEPVRLTELEARQLLMTLGWRKILITPRPGAYRAARLPMRRPACW